MKRSCHGDDFKVGGTKAHVKVVERAVFYGMEFHKYELNVQQININIYL